MARPAPTPTAPSRLAAWLPVVVVAAVGVVFGQCVGFGFVNWDDRGFLLENPLLHGCTWEHLRQLFTPGGVASELLYIPLTYLCHLVEATLAGGVRPGVVHGVNVALHAVNALLVYLLVRRLTAHAGAGFAAALIFALHPLQVEAVAWAMGRKDLLATALALGALLAYLAFLEGRRRYLAVALVCFTLALLAKPTVLLLPLLLPLLAWWRRERLSWRDGLPVLPFAALASVAWWLNTLVPAIPVPPASAAQKLLNLTYLPAVADEWLARFFLLSRPCPFYYAGDVTPDVIAWWACVPPLVLLVGLGWAWHTRRRLLLVGLVFIGLAFLPAAAPVIMRDREFLTADRYGYLPLVGAALLLALPVAALAGRWRTGYRVALALALGLAAVLTVGQARMWADSRALWTEVLARSPNNHLAWVLYGNWWNEQGQPDRARECYRTAIRLRPDYLRAYDNLRATWVLSGHKPRARAVFSQALRLKLYLLNDALRGLDPGGPPAPGAALAHYERGLTNRALGRLSAAAADFGRVVELAPESVDAHLQLGLVLAQQHAWPTAVEHFRAALARRPTAPDVLYALADAYMGQGRPEAAAPFFERLLVVAPESAYRQTAHLQLAIIARLAGDGAKAVAHCEQALALGPLASGDAYYEVARAYLVAGRRDEARRYVELARQHGAVIDTPLEPEPDEVPSP